MVGISVVALLVLAILPVLDVSSMYPEATAAQSTNGVLTMTFAGSLTTLNPFNAAWPDWWIIQLEYSFFGELNPNGSVNQLQSLVDWYSHNTNYTVWNFNVRPNARWSDGVPVNATDLIYTLNVSLEPANYPFSWAPNVVSITALNQSEVQVVLNSSTAQFGTFLMSQTTWPVIPYHVFGKQNIANFNNFGVNVVDGPFYVNGYTPGQSVITMLPNPYYWGPKPSISEIKIVLTTSTSSAPVLLKTGGADVGQIASSDVQGLASTPTISFLYEKNQFPTMLLWNTSSAPFNNLAFRQAFAHLINYTAIVQEGWNGLATPGAAGVYPQGNYYTNPNVPSYDYNVSLAGQLLQSIGYTNKSGQWYQPNGQPLSITILTDSSSANDVLSAEALSLMLQNEGISSTYQTLQVSTLRQQLHAGPMSNQIALFTWTGAFYPVPAFVLAAKVPPISTYAVSQPYWMGSPAATALYTNVYNNMSLHSNPTVIRAYAYQLQNLTATYLPYLTLDFPETIWAYNNTYTNWPVNGYLDLGSGVLNFTALTALKPPSAAVVSPPQSTPSASSYYAILIVLVALAVSVPAYLFRRRRSSSSAKGDS